MYLTAIRVLNFHLPYLGLLLDRLIVAVGITTNFPQKEKKTLKELKI